MRSMAAAPRAIVIIAVLTTPQMVIIDVLKLRGQ